MSEKLNRVDQVRKKYRLSETANVEFEQDGKPLGPGPVMAEETLQKFIDADPSGNNKYLEWMIFQAGGGQDAMEKSLALWDGEGPSDKNSLCSQCREDFIDECIKGFVEENGTKHPPVSRQQAEKQWEVWKERGRFEFVMGDQDVCFEDGFGFYRAWPGKNGIYQKVANAVQIWDQGIPKFRATNERMDRYETLLKKASSAWSVEEAKFVADYKENPVAARIELDIYKGWQPSEMGQPKAAYKNLEDLLAAVSDLRRAQVLRDARHEIVYEDEIVKAVAPLTIGASVKFGSVKWCTSTRTEFDRVFDPRQQGTNNWKNYTSKGVLVFLNFKCPMPEWTSKIALYVELEKLKTLRDPWSAVNFIDVKNESGGVKLEQIYDKIRDEHQARYSHDGDTPDESALRWNNRTPGTRAWNNREFGVNVMVSIQKALNAMAQWGRTFDHSKIAVDPIADLAQG